MDSTQDDLGGIVDQLQRLILESTPQTIPMARSYAIYQSTAVSAQVADLIPPSSGGSEQPYFDPNEPPSAAAALPNLDFEDGQTLLGLLETYSPGMNQDID